MPPKSSKLPAPITYQPPQPDYMALLPMFMEDINQLDHLLRGADGNKGLLERVAVLESLMSDVKPKIDEIHNYILVEKGRCKEPAEPEKPEAKPEAEKFSLKSLWPVLVIALTALITAIMEYVSK